MMMMKKEEDESCGGLNCMLWVLVACEDSRPWSCLDVGVGILSWNENLVGIGGSSNNVFVSRSNIHDHGLSYLIYM